MKLVAFAVLTTLGFGSAAHADPVHQRSQLQQALFERFDRNHDGQLQPDERRRAVRALRRLAHRLETQERRADHRDARQGGARRSRDAEPRHEPPIDER